MLFLTQSLFCNSLMRSVLLAVIGRGGRRTIGWTQMQWSVDRKTARTLFCFSKLNALVTGRVRCGQRSIVLLLPWKKSGRTCECVRLWQHCRITGNKQFWRLEPFDGVPSCIRVAWKEPKIGQWCTCTRGQDIDFLPHPRE